MKTRLLFAFLIMSILACNAQSYEWISSTEGNIWGQANIDLQKNQFPFLPLKLKAMKILPLSNRGVLASTSWVGMLSIYFQGSNRKLF